MSSTGLIIVFSLLAAAATLAGGLAATIPGRLKPRHLSHLIAFGAGYILAAALVSLLPESLALIPTAPLWVLVGYALAHLFEHTFTTHFHFGEETHAEHVVAPRVSITALVGLTLHAFFDGVAIHPYTLTRSPSDTATPRYSFKDSVPQFNGVLAAHGQAHKPIFITEMGWSTRDVSDRTRGRYLQEATAIARDWTNVPAMGAYTIRQTQFATFGLRTRTYAPTASWAAYAAVQR